MSQSSLLIRARITRFSVCVTGDARFAPAVIAPDLVASRARVSWRTGRMTNAALACRASVVQRKRMFETSWLPGSRRMTGGALPGIMVGRSPAGVAARAIG